jgi:uncharacterized protein YjbI with pentapeptide repeats
MWKPEQLAKLNEGVDAWNRWRAENPQITVDLRKADLETKDLSGADLRGANLEHANLRGAKLGLGTLLSKARLRDADLFQADLSGANLQDVNFAGANLFETKLREAYLCGVDLSGAHGGLRTEQLAGADLSGAELPEQLKTLYDKLENVKGISESARKIFLAVLAGCLYCWLTIATTTDVNLITNRASSPLPIIQTPIPIVGFYVVAPLLVLCVYFYFYFYLQKLWEELGSLPAFFPDGRALHTKVDPWLLNDLVRAHLPKLKVNRPFLSHFQLRISVLLAWWIVPLTLLLFWGRYLRRHEPVGTAFHVLLLVISLVGAVCLYRLAIATLRGLDRKPFRWKGLLTGRRGYLTTALTVALGVLFGLISWGAIWGIRSGAPILGIRLESEILWPRVTGFRTWVPRSMALIGNPPFANLTGAEVSQKKANRSGEKDEYLDFTTVALLSGGDLRYASGRQAFFAGANLENADLTGANLWGADLRGASLNSANLSGADLFLAHLHGAHLSGARLGDTSLKYADLSETDLSGAILTGDLNNAILTGANLSHSNLSTANLQEADLSGAILEGSTLGGADLAYSNLRETKGLDLQKVRTARNWEKAFYDCKTIQALSLPLDNNAKLFQELHKDELRKIRGELIEMLGNPLKPDGEQPVPCPAPKQ